MASKVKLSRTKSQNLLEPGKSSGRKSARIRNTESKEDDKETLAFKVLSAEHTKLLAGISDVNQLEEKLLEVYPLGSHTTDLQSSAILDHYVAGLWWGKQNNFTNEQLSAFFTVLHNLLDNVKEKHMTLTENILAFKKMLVGIGQECAELTGGLDCFSIQQAEKITDYLHSSLFQHHKMYEFMFSHTQAEEIIGTDLMVEVAPPASLPWPPPMEEGVSEEVYTGFIATPAPTPVVQPKESEREEPEVQKTTEEEGSDGEKVQDGAQEAELLAQLSAEEVQTIMDEVFQEMLQGVKDDVAAKLREKENAFINRINKIHRVVTPPASSPSLK